MNNYLVNKCNGPTNGREFWNAVKPLISTTNITSNDNIMLLENDIIAKEPNTLCELFNEYFVNIAQNIGTNDPILHGDTVSSITTQYENHSSIEFIKDHTMGAVGEFNFQYVSSDVIMSLLNKLNIRKATGCDNISPKLLRIGSQILCIPLTYLVNNCIQSSCFPDMLKQAEVTPIYKKNDVMDKCNYRPISVLPTISKILENVLVTQLNEYFEPIFSPRMSGFRKKHSCEDVLIDFIEEGIQFPEHALRPHIILYIYIIQSSNIHQNRRAPNSGFGLRVRSISLPSGTEVFSTPRGYTASSAPAGMLGRDSQKVLPRSCLGSLDSVVYKVTSSGDHTITI